MNAYMITIVVAIGAFSVSSLSIYFGYRLFLNGATGKFKFNAKLGSGSVGLESLAPGIGFALFGAGIAIYALFRLVGETVVR